MTSIHHIICVPAFHIDASKILGTDTNTYMRRIVTIIEQFC